MKMNKARALATIGLCFDLLDKGDTRSALKFIKPVLEHYPNNEDALFVAIESTINLGMFKEAESFISKYELYDQENPQMFYYKCLIAMHEKENLEEASRLIDHALLLEPDNFDYNIVKAQILYFLFDPLYRGFIEKVHLIDKRRAKNFMKNYWLEALPPKEDFNEDYVFEKLTKAMQSNNLKEMLHWIRVIKEIRPPKNILNYFSKIEISLLCKIGMTDEARFKLQGLKVAEAEKYSLMAEICMNENNLTEALNNINKTLELAKSSPTPGEYFLKAAILKKMNYSSFEEFQKKGEELAKKDLEKIKERMEKQGKKFETTDKGFIDFK